MRQLRKIGAAESAKIWDRWQRVEALKLIGRAFGRYASGQGDLEAGQRTMLPQQDLQFRVG